MDEPKLPQHLVDLGCERVLLTKEEKMFNRKCLAQYGQPAAGFERPEGRVFFHAQWGFLLKRGRP